MSPGSPGLQKAGTGSGNHGPQGNAEWFGVACCPVLRWAFRKSCRKSPHPVEAPLRGCRVFGNHRGSQAFRTALSALSGEVCRHPPWPGNCPRFFNRPASPVGTRWPIPASLQRGVKSACKRAGTKGPHRAPLGLGWRAKISAAGDTRGWMAKEMNPSGSEMFWSIHDRKISGCGGLWQIRRTMILCAALVSPLWTARHAEVTRARCRRERSFTPFRKSHPATLAWDTGLRRIPVSGNVLGRTLPGRPSQKIFAAKGASLILPLSTRSASANGRVFSDGAVLE